MTKPEEILEKWREPLAPQGMIIDNISFTRKDLLHLISLAQKSALQSTGRFQKGYFAGREEALEEAEKVAGEKGETGSDDRWDRGYACGRRDAAKAIRALKEAKP